MSFTLNSNRYICTVVKSGVSDFARFSGSSVHYLLRDQQGGLFVRSGSGPVQTVSFPSQSGKLNRTFVGEKLSISETLSDLPVVNAIGYNPYQMYKSEFNCDYYAYFDAGTWKTVGLESCIQGVFPSFAIVVVVGSGDKFLVMQTGDNVCVYSVGLSSLTKKSELENFTLVDTMASGNDIALLLVKKDTFYPSQGIYEALLGETVVYYKNSPVVFLCTSSSGYSSYSSFCQSRSVFPILCSPEDVVNSSSFFLHSSKFYVTSRGYDSSLDTFVPVASVGKPSDSWRYFDPVRPFSSVIGVVDPQICVDSDGITYVAGKKDGEVFLTYYNVTSRKWSNYDSASALTFEGAKISSSSSSSSCSSSSCSSSSCSCSSCSCSSSSCSCSSCSCSSSSCSCSSCSCSSSSCSCSSCSCSSSSCSSSSCSCSSCSCSSCSCSSSSCSCSSCSSSSCSCSSSSCSCSSCSCSSSSCSCSSSSMDLSIAFGVSIDTTTSSETFGIFFSNPTNLYVDWGDSTHNIYTYSGNIVYNHVYSSAGTYEISIVGYANNIRFNSSKLKSIVNPLDSITGLTSATAMFDSCSSLTTILSGLFDSCTNITDFNSTFRGCNITSIPPGLFNNNTLATDFSSTFGYCNYLLSIPSGLFNNNTLANTFSFTFGYCIALTSIPSGLFDYNTLVTDFTASFHGCSSIASIPSGLFNNNTLVTSFGGVFQGCSSIASIPSGLFDNNVLVTSFNSAFRGLGSISSIPSGLFVNNILAADFSSTFENCNVVTSNVPTLWISYPGASHTYCFRGCTYALNYASIPSDWK